MNGNETHTCVLCGTTFVGYGNNPEPLASFDDGRCCDDCNTTKVIPARIKRLTAKVTPGAFGTGKPYKESES